MFEANTTCVAKDMVQPGMHVIDVGANIGYFTLLMAEAVGPEAKGWGSWVLFDSLLCCAGLLVLRWPRRGSGQDPRVAREAY